MTTLSQFVRRHTAIDTIPDDAHTRIATSVLFSMRTLFGHKFCSINNGPFDALHVEIPGYSTRVYLQGRYPSWTETASDTHVRFSGAGTRWDVGDNPDREESVVALIESLVFETVNYVLVESGGEDDPTGGIVSGPGALFTVADSVVPETIDDVVCIELDPAIDGVLRNRGLGALFVPSGEIVFHLWRDSGEHYNLTNGAWATMIRATLIARSPGETIRYRYVPVAPKLQIGDRCETCGETWAVRALFNGTFVGCMC